MKKLYIISNKQDHEKINFDFLSGFYEIVFEMPRDTQLDLNILQLKKYYLKQLVSKQLMENTFFLLDLGNRLFLFDQHGNHLEIDFKNNHQDYLRKANCKKELLFRALGVKSKNIIDLSAGLAIDSVFMVQNGYNVTAIERNPLVFFMLNEAWLRAEDQIKTNLNFKFSESKAFIEDFLSLILKSDCIYFDPMYPEKKKSALPRQEMVLFKNLVGSDEDADEVFAKLIELKKRIVIKRPLKGKALLEKMREPSVSYAGKTVRYDVYL